MIFARRTALLFALIGAALLGISALGEVVNFNRPELDIPASRPSQPAKPYAWVARRLAVVDATLSSRSAFSLVYTLNTIVHERLVNYDATDARVFPIFSVGLFDNWLLWAAGKIGPKHYRDYFLPIHTLRSGAESACAASPHWLSWGYSMNAASRPEYLA